VKCIERPLYAVTVGASGEGFVSGGDGTIDQMRLQDGPIKAVMGLRVEEYIANERAQAEAEAAGEDEGGDGLVAKAGQASGFTGRQWLAGFALALGIAAAGGVAWLIVRE